MIIKEAGHTILHRDHRIKIVVSHRKDQVLAVAVRVKKQREGRIATIRGVTKHALWVRLSKNSTQMTMYFVHLDKVSVFSRSEGYAPFG